MRGLGLAPFWEEQFMSGEVPIEIEDSEDGLRFMAIEDAAVLARCLLQSNDYTRAFALYQTSRTPRVTKAIGSPPKRLPALSY